MLKLRIACVIANGRHVEPWVSRLLRRLDNHESFDLVAAIESSAGKDIDTGNFVSKGISVFEKFIFSRNARLAAHCTKMEDQPVNIIPINELSALKDLNLSVIVDCTGKAEHYNLSRIAIYGVWTLDFLLLPESLVGFWEVCKSKPVLDIKLCQFNPAADQFEVLVMANVNLKFCASKSAAFIKEKSISLLIRELNQLRRTLSVESQTILQIPKARYPSIVDALNYIFKVASAIYDRFIVLLLNKVKMRPNMFFLKYGTGTFVDFNDVNMIDIMPEGNNYWADPFLLEKGEETFVFFETYNYQSKRGHISVGRLNSGQFEFLGDAITTDYHLSFPFLFEDEGELFMMPETHEKRRLEIWRCIEFPLKWVLHNTALDGMSVADSTLLSHNKEWWLFTNVSDDVFEDHCSELHIYKADGPQLNHLETHINNPVVFDSRTARNAGRIFEVDGILYRPSQDNAFGQYGYGLNIMELETLSLQEYKERPIKEINIKTGKGARGVHHFDSGADYFIFDAQKKFGGFP